ncbi:MarR family transcriptional regulator [Streptomyces spiroverticillatus]|uniref:MarR family transcriptional regulator n=1 Tax=Streptomyces finlayi TaxID=67296 RepID=A0A918WWY8_9ACTN|nr:MarR family transcriptional regulator [Streptomyces finlayi]GHA08754.1 MarR family transcriptional regulator [Streptomyces spiroverticillatus]GHC91627.1 MarR family transcriptional regulator [Streptomyces finlayi]
MTVNGKTPEGGAAPTPASGAARTRDHVDHVLDQWHAQRPDLDVSPMAVIGRLKRLMLLIDPEMKRTFAAHGLDRASFDVLATLRRNGPDNPLTPAELMASAMVTSGAVTQRLDRLQGRGLITRRPSPTDGRVVQVALTERGLTLVEATLPDHLATETRLLSALSPAEQEQLALLMRTLLLGLGDEF